jgi:hypothetical protein
VGLERLPDFETMEILRDYQQDDRFELDIHFRKIPSPDPAPKVETASLGPVSLKPSAENDAKDDDYGVHDWYKAVAGDEEAFDKLFSSIEFVDEPLE